MWPFSSKKRPSLPSFLDGTRYIRQLPQGWLEFVAPVSNGDQVLEQVEFSEVADIGEFSFKPLFNREEIDSLIVHWLYEGCWLLKGPSIISPRAGDVRCLIGIVKSGSRSINESLFTSKDFINLIRQESELSTVDDSFEYMSGPKSFSLLDETLAENLEGFDLATYRAARHLEMANSQWSLLKGMPVFYAESVQTSGTVHYCDWRMPLDDDHYLYIRFCFRRSASNAGNYYRVSQRVPLAPFYACMYRFLEGFNFTPLPDLVVKMTDLADEVLANKAPRIEPASDFIYSAKWAMKKASGMEYRASDNENEEITPTEASDFIDNLLRPRPIPGSYGFDGPVTYAHHQASLSPVPLSFRKEVPPPVG